MIVVIAWIEKRDAEAYKKALLQYFPVSDNADGATTSAAGQGRGRDGWKRRLAATVGTIVTPLTPFPSPHGQMKQATIQVAPRVGVAARQEDAQAGAAAGASVQAGSPESCSNAIEEKD
jgi:hypothetical protein